MLRNLSAGNFIAEDNTVTLPSYLRTLKENPSRLVSLLAIFIIPAVALGWWYYSLAMSAGSLSSINSALESSEEIIISEPQLIPEVSNGTEVPGSTPSSSVSNERIDVKINSNAPQENVVEVDGQSIPVPADGSTHQVIQNDNGKTTIDINVDSDSSGTSKVRSSTNINLRSSSDMDVDIESEEVQ